MNKKLCRFCEYSDPSRKNKNGKIRCRKSYKLVPSDFCCEFFFWKLSPELKEAYTELSKLVSD